MFSCVRLLLLHYNNIQPEPIILENFGNGPTFLRPQFDMFAQLKLKNRQMQSRSVLTSN